MIIQNHRLVASQSDERVSFRLDELGPPLRPEVAIIHYAVTQSAASTAATLKAKDYLSCHVTIDNAGNLIQQVPFDRVAYHAGKSSYRGRDGCNAFSLGVEVSVPGPVFRQPGGTFRDIYGKPWAGEAVEAQHKSGLAPKNWTHWAVVSDRARDMLAHLVDLWRAEYGITDVVGHDDVSPGRKFDPGPCFDVGWLRAVVFGPSNA